MKKGPVYIFFVVPKWANIFAPRRIDDLHRAPSFSRSRSGHLQTKSLIQWEAHGGEATIGIANYFLLILLQCECPREEWTIYTGGRFPLVRARKSIL